LGEELDTCQRIGKELDTHFLHSTNDPDSVSCRATDWSPSHATIDEITGVGLLQKMGRAIHYADRLIGRARSAKPAIS
jgi:hypothetical protein